MKREDAIPYVSYVCDDALCCRELGADPHAIIRDRTKHRYPSRIIGWQCGFEPMFVAVHSHLDVELDDEEAIEITTDFLKEIGWFANGQTEPDFIM